MSWGVGPILMGSNGPQITSNSYLIPFYNSDYGLFCTNDPSVTPTYFTAQLYRVITDNTTPTGYALDFSTSVLTIGGQIPWSGNGTPAPGTGTVCVLEHAICWLTNTGSQTDFIDSPMLTDFISVIALVDGALEYSGPQQTVQAYPAWGGSFASTTGLLMTRTGPDRMLFGYGIGPGDNGTFSSAYHAGATTLVGCSFDGATILTEDVTTTPREDVGVTSPIRGGGQYLMFWHFDGNYVLGINSNSAVNTLTQRMIGVPYTPGVGLASTSGFETVTPVFSNLIPLSIEGTSNFVIRPFTGGIEQPYGCALSGESFTFDTTNVISQFPFTTGAATPGLHFDAYMLLGIVGNPRVVQYARTGQSGTSIFLETQAETAVDQANPYYAGFSHTWSIQSFARHGADLCAAIIKDTNLGVNRFFITAFATP